MSWVWADFVPRRMNVAVAISRFARISPRLHAVPFFSLTDWETGASEMRDRARDWSETAAREKKGTACSLDCPRVKLAKTTHIPPSRTGNTNKAKSEFWGSSYSWNSLYCIAYVMISHVISYIDANRQWLRCACERYQRNTRSELELPVAKPRGSTRHSPWYRLGQVPAQNGLRLKRPTKMQYVEYRGHVQSQTKSIQRIRTTTKQNNWQWCKTPRSARLETQCGQ